jgi:hypothetical protein
VYLRLMVKVWEQEAARKQRAKLAAAAEARTKRKAELRERLNQAKEWSEEEIRMLDKALSKLPVGVPRRWEQITSYVRTRTQSEILFMVKVRSLKDLKLPNLLPVRILRRDVLLLFALENFPVE